MSDVVTASDLEGPVRAALRRHILTLADSKRILGLRYSDWLLGAPSIETGIAASSMAQDEWGHARLLYAMLKDFDEDPSVVEHDRPRERYTNVSVLDDPFSDWAGFVVAMTVVDGALTAALEAFSEGRYEAARSRIPKMLGEEEFHRDMGLAWLRRLGRGSDEARSRLVEAGRFALPPTLAWLAPSDAMHTALVEAGLVTPRETVLERFRERYGPTMEAVGIAMPQAAEGDWDEVRGRSGGAPDQEVVERARGDLNRALLVE
ncbi:MAG: phenylacetate-CoA oxygenase subunit PaaI [Gemmatimonadota bacterium]|jgi:ring-1,2-phenylacetyl-CoA epoxidase subunit PaaC